MSKKEPRQKIKSTCFKCQSFKEIAAVLHGHPLCERCYTMTQNTESDNRRKKR